MPSDESKGSQLDAIGSLAQRQLDNTVDRVLEGSRLCFWTRRAGDRYSHRGNEFLPHRSWFSFSGDRLLHLRIARGMSRPLLNLVG